MPGTRSANTGGEPPRPATQRAAGRRPVLVTGANGFVGREIVRALEQRGHAVRRTVRRLTEDSPADTVQLDIGPHADWAAALEGVDAVVHVAGCAHRLDASDEVVQREMFRVNTEGTRALTAAARSGGVGTLVFISSIGAAAERSVDDLDEQAPCRPETAYGRSKLAAETAIADERGSMRAVILRPPLVYGKGAPGNFARLLGAVRRRWPLPFGAVHNRRSFIFSGNLADAVAVAVEDPRAEGVFHVADSRPVSTPEFIEAVAAAVGVAPRLWSMPPAWLVPGARLFGMSGAVAKLTESLPVDASRFRNRVAWTPPWEMPRALVESLRS